SNERVLATRAVFVNGARDQFLSGAAFAGDQDTACLRSDVFDELKNGLHLRAGSDDVIEPRKAPNLPAQVTGFLLESQVLSHLLNRRPQFVEQAVALD